MKCSEQCLPGTRLCVKSVLAIVNIVGTIIIFTTIMLNSVIHLGLD